MKTLDFRRAGLARTLATALVLTAIGLITPIFSTDVRTQTTTGRQFYVATNGSPSNDGSQARPLDLATALGGASPARPGDTIWLRGGIYTGNFTSQLTGSPAAPIVVRQYPGERATIDANTSNRGAPGLAVNGADTWYWGFEVTDTNTQRVNATRATSIDVYGARTKFINLVVHDGLQGFGLWSSAIEAEIYGTLIYNVGVENTDRGHGHSIYTQNQTGIKQITDNILFNSFSFGIHAYTEGGAIDNFRFEGNVAFNHGLLSASGAKANFLLGGRKVAHDAVIVDNYWYYTPGSGGRGFDLGYVTPCDRPTIQGNYAAGSTPLQLNCTNAAVIGNTFQGNIPGALPAAYPNNTFYTTRPTGVMVDVRPNRYETGRGHVVIYSWDRLSSVDADLSPLGLQTGDRYEIRDAQNFFGPAVTAGTYSGAPVAIRMTGLTAVAPIGNAPRRPPHTAPEFGVFIVLRTGQGAPPPPPPPVLPTASLSASPTSIPSGQTSTLAWSTTNATSVRIDPGIGTVTASGTRAVTPSATTTYTLTATNAAGSVTSTPVTVTVTTSGGGGGGTSATFVRTDTATQGNWRGVYGTEGYSLATDVKALPAYAQVTMTGNLGWTWSPDTTDVRGLQRPTGTKRFAATWYNQSSFVVDVGITDGKSHRVALYVVDWDTASKRVQTIEVLDASTNAVLDRRSVASFRGGQYLVWQVSGRVRFRLTKTVWDAVTSGIFFDQ